MKNFVTIRNVTERTLPAFYGGHRYALTPQGTEGSEITVTEAIAKHFIEHYGLDHVKVITEDEAIEYVPPVEQKSTTWLANITGDPDAPREVYAGQAPDGKPVYARNPDAVAHPVVVECYTPGRGQISTKSADGSWNAYTQRKRVFALKPGERREFPATIAQQFLMQQKARSLDAPQSVIISRPKSEYEPTMKWELNAMRYWFMLTSPDGMNPKLHGPSDADLRAEYANDDDGYALAVHRAKLELYKRCYRLMVDPEIPLPTKKQLEDFMSKQLKAEAQGTKTRKLDADDIAAQLQP